MEKTMARIAGVNVPDQKRVSIALTYIHGIGRTSAREICDTVGIDRTRRMKDLTEEELNLIRKEIDSDKFTIEGEREITRNIPHYNLDVIISVGYRVKSIRGTQFRIYATFTQNLYDKGFNLDKERFKEIGGGTYFEELLNEIRDIRSSEKV